MACLRAVGGDFLRLLGTPSARVLLSMLPGSVPAGRREGGRDELERAVGLRSIALVLLAPAALLALALGAGANAGAPARAAAANAGAPAAAGTRHVTIACGAWRPQRPIACPDVYDSQRVFGRYVGHDEPGIHFYSHVPGSGNRARWLLTLPRDPSPSRVPGAHVYSFENHLTFWFGMALCASQSYPELVRTCRPDSDTNIVNPKVSPDHAGSAYLELQFYPPGYAGTNLPGFGGFPSGFSCDGTRWCAAMNVFSLYQNPVTGQTLNRACQRRVGGVELDNFAFITRDGRPTGPPNPLGADAATFTPNRDVLRLGQGDRVSVTIEDSPSGLLTALDDLTTGQTGYMIASAQNGFGQLVFAPNPSRECRVTRYSFRPMYSTSTPQTRATWTAVPYNVAYSDEIGHFDYCSQVNRTKHVCTGLEGAPGRQERADFDDNYLCFGPGQVLRDRVGGCLSANVGFDGTSYTNDWPDGRPDKPTPVMFTSPLTGPRFTINYLSSALVTDLPLVESADPLQHCNIYADTGCRRFPLTDEGEPAQFYPFFYTAHTDGCSWGEGTYDPGLTVNDFGRQKQYGTYDRGVYYTGPGGKPYSYASMFRFIYPANLCPARAGPA